MRNQLLRLALTAAFALGVAAAPATAARAQAYRASRSLHRAVPGGRRHGTLRRARSSRSSKSSSARRSWSKTARGLAP